MIKFPMELNWIKTENPTLADNILGKVILVYFWTSSNINSIKSINMLNNLYSKYKVYGFEILGVHIPEFDFEFDINNVLNAVQYYNIQFPIITNVINQQLKAFKNPIQPAYYLHNDMGHIVYKDYKCEYEIIEEHIKQLLVLKGEKIKDLPESINFPTKFPLLNLSNCYLGYNKLFNFASFEKINNSKIQKYTIPAPIKKNHVYFEGVWQIEKNKSILKKAGGKIIYRYYGNKLNIIMGAGLPVKAKVLIDEKRLELGNSGEDIDDSGSVNIKEYRLYNLINTYNIYETHTCEIIFKNKDVEVYAFTIEEN